jgi:hypothetical protein
MRWPLRRRSKDQELDEEILAHLAIETKRRVEDGETGKRRSVPLAANSATLQSLRRSRAECGGTASSNP